MMPTQTNNKPCKLLEKLKALQAENEWSDAKFARRLGVTKSLWDAVRNGRRSISTKVLKGAVKNYPQFIPDVIEFLRDC